MGLYSHQWCRAGAQSLDPSLQCTAPVRRKTADHMKNDKCCPYCTNADEHDVPLKCWGTLVLAPHTRLSHELADGVPMLVTASNNAPTDEQPQARSGQIWPGQRNQCYKPNNCQATHVNSSFSVHGYIHTSTKLERIICARLTTAWLQCPCFHFSAGTSTATLQHNPSAVLKPPSPDSPPTTMLHGM